MNDRNNYKTGILQVLPAVISGGVERGTIEVAGALAKQGFRPLVASSGGPMISQIYHVGAKHILLPLASKNPWQIYRNSQELEYIIKSNDIKIIHARSRAPAWSAYMAAKATNCKFVTTFHGVYTINNALKRYYNSIMVKGAKVIAVSNFIAEHIKEHYSPAEDALRVIHRGVDMEYFNPSNIAEHRLVQLVTKLNIPVDRPIVLLPGRITRWKGQHILLKAISTLPRGSVFCLIVGSDHGHTKYRKELNNMIAEYNLAQDAAIINNVMDMPALYLLADIVVSASIEPEAFGRVVTEAQAMGRLLIASDLGGARETVIPGVTGNLVTAGNHEELAETIKQLLTMSQQERNSRAEAARNHIDKFFSIEQMCKKTIDVYKEVTAL